MQPERSAVGPHGPRVDAVALHRTTRRLMAAGQVPWLHEEAARRMAERLPFIRRQPAVLVDGSGPLGGSTALLQAAYPAARHQAVLGPGQALAMPARKSWWTFGRKTLAAVDLLRPDEIAPESVDLLWSNMTLHGQVDPLTVFRDWHRSVAVDGFLMFSTLGPGSLPELREIYRQSGWGVPLLPFVDMHDLGDMLVEAGFSDPVMDQELVTLSWPDPQALLKELRGLGANLSPQRFSGLRTPRWRERLLAALKSRAPDGRPSLTFELVYGHAFRVATRARVQAQTNVTLDEMRSMIRASKP